MISITKWKTIVPIRSRKPGKKVLTNQVRISPQNKTYPTHMRCKGETVAIRVLVENYKNKFAIQQIRMFC